MSLSGVPYLGRKLRCALGMAAQRRAGYDLLGMGWGRVGWYLGTLIPGCACTF